MQSRVAIIDHAEICREDRWVRNLLVLALYGYARGLPAMETRAVLIGLTLSTD